MINWIKLSAVSTLTGSGYMSPEITWANVIEDNV